MYQFLYKIFSTPFGYVMRYIYQFVGDYALAIFLFALLVKVLMMPLNMKSKRAMMAVQRLNPKIQQIQKTYGRDQRRMNEELQKLYEKEGVSPMSGCGTQLIILPIMIGLYGVVIQPLTYFMQLTAAQISEIATRLGYEMTGYTSQIGLAGLIHDNFDKVADISSRLMKVDFHLGPIDLTQTANFRQPSILWIIPLLSGLTALLFSLMQQKLNQNQLGGEQAQSTGKTMLLVMPLMSLWFSFMLPNALGIYWISNNILSAVQELLLNKWAKKQAEKENNLN
ncbi:MAG: YidC/Oxa1 family membrane protein insertase [Clostridia bacterium]|nr:YidC/Oxa1 family membrane protein insertase [Clostridia bacterium]